MLENNTLSEFMYNFLGYGDFNADIWFIGMEEGGGKSLDDVQTRIGTWAKRGRHILEDCPEYHQAMRGGQLSTLPVRKAQPTWDWLMRVQLKSEGKAHDKEASKVMQGERWLRHGSKTCGLELLPLPSPTTGDWFYKHFSNNPILRSRAIYREAMLPTRIAAIKSAINEYKPRHVIFYSKTYLAIWEQIVGMDLTEVDGLHITQARDTSYLCTVHPSWPIRGGSGAKIAYWEDVGARLVDA